MRIVIAEGQFLLRDGLTHMLEAHVQGVYLPGIQQAGSKTFGERQ